MDYHFALQVEISLATFLMLLGIGLKVVIFLLLTNTSIFLALEIP